MNRRWLSRALIALAVPVALTAPTVNSTATAAGAGPGVPSIAAAATVYPHLAGGTSTESTSKVLGLGKNCKPGKPIKGASSKTASYTPAYDPADPSSYLMTGAKPSVFVTSMKFPTAKAAIAYLHKSTASTKKCPVTASNPDGTKVDATVTRIRFKLGDERWGYQTRLTMSGQTVISNMLFVRKGKFIVYTGAMAMDGTAPSVPQSVQFTKVALSSVR